MVTAILMATPRTPRKPKPAWALAIELRRTTLQLSQELAAERAEMSQSYYSEVERGDKPLHSLTLGKLLGLARALEWTLSEMQQATGLDLGIPTAEPLASGEPTPVYSLTALGKDKPKPEGFNVTPHPGPHPAEWMQTFMEGDEMLPKIREGESIYFDTTKTTPDKGIYVIRHDGRAYVRRYSTLPSGPAWTADNPAYALNFIPASSSISVLGKVYRVVGIREATSLLN